MRVFVLVLILCVCTGVLAKGSAEFSGNVTSNVHDNNRTVLDYDLQYRQVTVVIRSAEDIPPAGGFLFVSSSVTPTNSKGDEIQDYSEDSDDDHSGGDDGHSDDDHPENDEDHYDDARPTDSHPTDAHPTDDAHPTESHPSDDHSDDNGSHGNNGNTRRRAKSVTLVGGANIAASNNLFTTYIAAFRTGDSNSNNFIHYFNKGSNGGNFAAVNSALGYIVSVLTSLQELDSDGNVVANMTLDNLNWVFSPVQNDATGHLYTVTATGNSTNSTLSISISFLLSSVVGRVDMANATVTPKTIESVINITGYTLSNSTNRLALTFAVAGGPRPKVTQGQGLVSGSSFASGEYSDGSQVFFSLANSCFVNGSRVPTPVVLKNVTITPQDRAKYTSSDYAAFAGARIKYGSNGMSVQVVQVVFPQGATSIEYDPTTGAGQTVTDPPITTSTNSAVAGKYTYGLLLACVTLLVSYLM